MILAFSRRYWRRMILYSSLSLCNSLLLIPSALLYRDLIDGALAYAMGLGGDAYALILTGGLLIAIYIALNVIRFYSNYCWRCIGSEAARDLSLEFYGRIVQLPLRDYRRVSAGEYAARLATDCDKFANFALGFTSGVALGLIRLLVRGYVLFSLSPHLLAMLMAAVPAYLLVYRRHVNALADTAEMERRVWGGFVNSLMEFLGNILLIKERGALDFSKRMLASRLRSQLEYRRRILRIIGKNGLINSMMSDLTPIGLLALGSYLLTMGYLSVGSLMPFIAYSRGLMQELGTLSYRFLRLSAVKPHAERIAELLRAPVRERGGRRLGRVESLELKRVSFSYDGEQVLRGVDLSLRRGETVAIVGESGAGKSTLALIMAGLLKPDSGEVLVNSVAIDEYDSSDLRSKIAYVPQAAPLLSMSLRENIAFGREVDEGELSRILEACGIRELAPLLDERVGSGGRELSDGQRQRVAIARALVTKPDVFILDEALSAVDAKTEGRVLRGVRDYLGSSAILVVISHRLSTVRGSDRIVVLRDGGIADIGRHEELLERCEAYRELIERQLIREE
ncbi:MAG: ABC transporter ATP-binding protein [Thermoproteales archaeon]|nr:ABC transporter ATP-binding protein [Thermoproteales archaeon]